MSDVQTRLQRQMGDANSAQFILADVIRWINDAQRDISFQNDVWQKIGTQNSTTGVSTYTLPTDFQKIRRVAYLGGSLQQQTLEQVTETVPQHDQTVAQGYPTGTPILYWIYANTLNLYPSPQSTDTGGLTIYYTRKPTDVVNSTDAIDLPDEYFNRVMEYCLAQAYEVDTNYYEAGAKAQQYESGVAALKGNADWEIQTSYPSITYTPEYDAMMGQY